MSSRWNKYIATLLLLVYTNQAIAALMMPCQMDMSSKAIGTVMPVTHQGVGHNMHEMAHDHATMGHSLSHDGKSIDAATTAAQPADGHDKFDCCDAMGHCLMGSCMIHGASNTFVQALEDPARKAAPSAHLKSPSRLTSVHFRPPIFA